MHPTWGYFGSTKLELLVEQVAGMLQVRSASLPSPRAVCSEHGSATSRGLSTPKVYSQAAKENFQTIRRGLVGTQGNFLTLSIILRKNKQCEIAQDCLEPKTKCSSAGKAG